MSKQLIKLLNVDDPRFELSSVPNLDWHRILGQARRAGLLGRLAFKFSKLGLLDQVPENPRRYLKGALFLVERQRNEVIWEVSQIVRALKPFKIPVVLLKGAAYLIKNLPASEGRLFSDIDILVEKNAILETEGALFGAGWICDERDPYNQKYYRQWMHEIPPLRHVIRNSFIDLHHAISPLTSKYTVDSRLLLDKIESISNEENLYTFCDEDMLLHSMLHLFQESEFDHGLRDIFDIRDLMLFHANAVDFYNKLILRSNELNIFYPFVVMFTLVQISVGLPDHFRFKPIDQLSAIGRLRAKILIYLLHCSIQPTHPSSDSILAFFSRFLLYVRSHLIKMPLYLVLPHLARKAWMKRFPKEVSA